MSLWRMAAIMAVLSPLIISCQHRDSPQSAGTAANPENLVVRYMSGAERQSETAGQEQEILKALIDLRTLSAEALRTRRYADYGLTPGQWNLAQLLEKYYVPLTPISLDTETLYRDAQDPRAKSVIDAQIKAIQEHRQVIPAK